MIFVVVAVTAAAALVDRGLWAVGSACLTQTYQRFPTSNALYL